MFGNPVTDALRAQNNPYENLILSILQYESLPLNDLVFKRDEEERVKNVLSDFDSTLSSFNTLLESFTDSISNPFQARAASASDSSAFTVTASDDADLGSHTLNVQRLASTDTRITDQFASAGGDLRSFFDTNGTQTFSIEVASPTDEDENNRVSIDVTVDPAGTTNEDILDEISAAINDAMDAAAEAGTIKESAQAIGSVINETSDTARFSLRSGGTGYANRLDFTDSGSGLLATLGITNTALVGDTTGGMVTTVGTSETDSELNSKFVLDGLTLYRSGNQVDDALDGLTIDLAQVSEAPSDFTVTPDKDSITNEVKNFIDAYNDVLDFLQLSTDVDGDLDLRADFAGDTTFTNLRFDLRNNVIQQVTGQPAEAPTFLTDLGIEINDDGTLSLEDEDALISAIEVNPDAVQSLFAGDDGVATRMESLIDGFLGADGILDNRMDSMQSTIDRYDDRITDFEDSLAQREEQLRLQFAQVQETITALQSQQSFLFGFFG